MKPTRAAPTGPMNGTPDSVSAAEAATSAENVGIVLQVMAEHGDDDLRLAAEPVGEQRADRAVDQARGQRLAVGQAAFALEVAAGNAAGGEGLLLVVDGQREEILAGLGAPWRRRRWRARWSRPRSPAPRRRPDGRCGRFRARACARTSRVLHVEYQTSFILFMWKGCESRWPCRGRLRTCPSSARRRGAGASRRQPLAILPRAFDLERPTLDGLSDLRREGPSRSQRDARLSRSYSVGRRPHAAARYARGRQRRMPRRSISVL